MSKQISVNIADAVGKGYSKFFNDKTHRYVVVKGSRGSKKSKTTALWTIYNLLKYPLSNCLVVRRVYNTLYDSCYADLKWAITRLNVSHMFECQKIPLRIIRKDTGQQIIFRGMDTPESLTSISVSVGVLNFVWVEEAFQIESEDMFNMLDFSIRGELPDGYFYRFNITFNPWRPCWLRTRFFDNPDKNTLALTTTYKCNEWLGEDVRAMMDELCVTNPRRARVECLGDWGIVVGNIYENWHTEVFEVENLLKNNASYKHLVGLDFGFKDSTAIVCMYISKEFNKIYVYDEFYKNKITNKDIISTLIDKGLNNERIICDSAEPKSIEELRRGGIPLATPCIKGKNSVDYGIQLVQNYEIIVHPRCEEFIREISNYAYLENGKPDHDYSHSMDALRYACTWFEKGLPKPKKRLRKSWFI